MCFKKKFSNKNHPELKEGEVWLMNADLTTFSEIKYDTKRMGDIAYDESGKQDGDPWNHPIFVQRSELYQLGEDPEHELGDGKKVWFGIPSSLYPAFFTLFVFLAVLLYLWSH